MMGKLKRKYRFSARACILAAVGFLLITMVLYEVIIVCALDKLTESKPLITKATVAHIRSSEIDKHYRIEADKVLHEISGYKEHDLDELSKNQIINTVHYVWCPNETFSFRNYVSIISVWKTLRPDIIEFHHQVVPQEDKYDDWLIKVKQTIPSFVMKVLPPNWDGDDKGCGFWFGLAVIEDRGGIYVGEDILVTDAMLSFLQEKKTFFFSQQPSDKHTKVAVAMGMDHDQDFKTFRRNFAADLKTPDNAVFCDAVTMGYVNDTSAPCYHMNEGFTPRDVFTSDTAFSKLVRKIIYGSMEKRVPKQLLPGYIPKIVHYVWFGGKEMNFMMYLSMLSTLYILNPDKVIIHTDGGLTGPYLERVKKDKRVLLIIREKPYEIYGHKVLYAQHRSDIVRAECLLKFGGIYMDWDVLWLKDPQELIDTGYDAIANFDHMQQGNFPDTINLGVFMAKPKSAFVKRWQDALINYKSKDFLYNAVQLPYKIYEQYPQYIHIEKTLQVMCFRLKCHPVFHPNFKTFTEEQPFDWRRDVYSIHFTYPDPDELTNERACRNGTGRFAEIGQYILQNEHKLGKV